MTILVIGREGQLARSLAERGGTDVICLGRPDLDLSVPGSARTAILAAAPRLIVNAAAFTAVDLAEGDEPAARRINEEAAGEIATAGNEIGVPLIHISTDYVFDGEGGTPYREDAATRPINAYGKTKLAGEKAVRDAAADHMILRTSWLVSPFGHNFVRTMVELGLQRDSLSVVADQHGNPTSALDLADLIVAIARRWGDGERTGLGQTYHLAGSGAGSWFELATAVQEELSQLGLHRAIVNPILTAAWPTPAKRPANSALNCSKFTAAFGFGLPHWRASLADIVGRLAH